MSFSIKLYTNNSEENRVDKDLTEITTLTGTLRAQSSIIDPVIVAELETVPKQANYMYIAEFGRYYFIKNIVCVRTGIYEITAHVDVLTSFADQLRECRGIIRRSENDWNTYLNDGVFKTYQIPQTVCKYFPTGFTIVPQYVLTTI